MSDETTFSGSPSARPLGDDSTGYDPTTETFHTRFDVDSDSIVVALIDTVAAVTNRGPTAMAPLYETVDPEALSELVTSAHDHPIRVSFDYEGCQVSVSSDGHIAVEPPEN